jgi:uncharacterized protein (DUF58 family)
MKIEFGASFLRKLETLSIVSKRLFAGRMKGERRSPRRGQSVEFADFRDYSQGDDYRHIDWNAYARLESMFLKLFVEEEDLHIHLLLDRSKSMDFGTPNKLEFAGRVAAALAYIGLSNLDRVSLSAFSAEGLQSLPFQHGKQTVFSVLEFLQRLQPGGSTDLSRSVDAFVRQARHKGIVILLSDFLCHDGYQQALTRLRYSKFEPIAVQVLAPDEVEPPLGGDWSFTDSENGSKVDLSLGPRAVTLYKQRLRSYCDEMDQFCRSHDIAVLRAVTNQDFEDLVLRYFRAAALIA